MKGDEGKLKGVGVGDLLRRAALLPARTMKLKIRRMAAKQI
jgi:hypothetical protein